MRRKQVTMLVDPRGKVHATTGILPIKSIDIPQDQYRDALSAIEVCFLTAPVLSVNHSVASNAPAIDLPIPHEPGYTWTRRERAKSNDGIDPTPQDWRDTRKIGRIKTDAHLDGKSVIREGWLVLQPTDHATDEDAAKAQFLKMQQSHLKTDFLQQLKLLLSYTLSARAASRLISGDDLTREILPRLQDEFSDIAHNVKGAAQARQQILWAGGEKAHERLAALAAIKPDPVLNAPANLADILGTLSRFDMRRKRFVSFVDASINKAKDRYISISYQIFLALGRAFDAERAKAFERTESAQLKKNLTYIQKMLDAGDDLNDVIAGLVPLWATIAQTKLDWIQLARSPRYAVQLASFLELEKKRTQFSIDLIHNLPPVITALFQATDQAALQHDYEKIRKLMYKAYKLVHDQDHVSALNGLPSISENLLVFQSSIDLWKEARKHLSTTMP